jgi:Tol biopolymer transport system component
VAAVKRPLATVLACCAALPGAAAPASGSTASFLVYSCGRTADAANDPNGRTDLCRVDADGRHPRLLTNDGAVGGGKYGLPSLARNGAALAFNYGFPDRQLFTANADASARRLVSSADVTGVAMSPDGGRVAWIEQGLLQVAARDGSARRTGAAGLSQPTWMGRRLLAVTRVHNRPQVCLVRADLAGCERIVAGGRHLDVTSPAASPDGRFVAARVDGDRLGVALFSTRTGRMLRMLTPPRDPNYVGADHPAWSPDGQALAYDDVSEIYVRSMTRGGGRQLLVDAADHPSWAGAFGRRSPRLRITHARVRGKRLSVAGRIRRGAPAPLWATFDGQEWPNRIYATFHPRVRHGRFRFSYRIRHRYAYFCDVVVSTPGDRTYLRAAAHVRPRGGVCKSGG